MRLIRWWIAILSSPPPLFDLMFKTRVFFQSSHWTGSSVYLHLSHFCIPLSCWRVWVHSKNISWGFFSRAVKPSEDITSCLLLINMRIWKDRSFSPDHREKNFNLYNSVDHRWKCPLHWESLPSPSIYKKTWHFLYLWRSVTALLVIWTFVSWTFCNWKFGKWTFCACLMFCGQTFRCWTFNTPDLSSSDLSIPDLLRPDL